MSTTQSNFYQVDVLRAKWEAKPCFHYGLHAYILYKKKIKIKMNKWGGGINTKRLVLGKRKHKNKYLKIWITFNSAFVLQSDRKRFTIGRSRTAQQSFSVVLNFLWWLSQGNGCKFIFLYPCFTCFIYACNLLQVHFCSIGTWRANINWRGGTKELFFLMARFSALCLVKG